MANAKTAMQLASKACLTKLAKALGRKIGPTPFDIKGYETAFYCQTLPDDVADIFGFLLTGGRDQNQNRQHARPHTQYAGEGRLHGQFYTEEGAWTFLGEILDLFDLTADADGIVLKPNVRVFRPTTHPELSDEKHVIGDNGEFHILWHVRITFLIVYGIEQT